MITHRIVSTEPTPLEQLVPDASAELVAIVTTALKKSSAQRFKDAETMRIAISRVRREYESDGDWNTPTMPVGRDVAPPAGGSRGTGSARRRSNDVVGVAQLTPPPDPRRTDREALARRRAAQLEAALLLARTLFEQQQLDEALDACQQALTLDETHVGALELEQEISTAIRIREGVEIAADDGVADDRERSLDSGSRARGIEDASVAGGHALATKSSTRSPGCRRRHRSSGSRTRCPISRVDISDVTDQTVLRRPRSRYLKRPSSRPRAGPRLLCQCRQRHRQRRQRPSSRRRRRNRRAGKGYGKKGSGQESDRPNLFAPVLQALPPQCRPLARPCGA